MKNLFTLGISFLFLVHLNSCAISKVTLETPPPRVATFENDHSKDENYVLANEWMVETFNNAESVIQFTDKESGTVKGKYIIKEGFVSTSPYAASRDALFAIITIRVRDSSSRIEIAPPTGEFYSLKSMGTEYGYTPEMFEEDTNELILDFKTRMQGDVGGDW
ncbi:DUF4468 domain-containing protein [Peijinzhouia sedimentorum]